jgi:hypothetical protein
MPPAAGFCHFNPQAGSIAAVGNPREGEWIRTDASGDYQVGDRPGDITGIGIVRPSRSDIAIEVTRDATGVIVASLGKRAPGYERDC